MSIRIVCTTKPALTHRVTNLFRLHTNWVSVWVGVNSAVISQISHPNVTTNGKLLKNITSAMSITYCFFVLSLVHLDIVHQHSLWLLTNSLASQAWNIFTDKLMSMSHIFWCHCPVCNQVGTYHAFKILLWCISYHSLKPACHDEPFHLLLGVPFKFLMNGSNKNYSCLILFFKVQVM